MQAWDTDRASSLNQEFRDLETRRITTQIAK